MPASEAPIIRRRVNIDFDSAHAAQWFGDNPGTGHAMNALSFVLPQGEAYFAQSVRYYIDRIEDPKLKEEARDFVYQEAVHAKEHSRSNEALKRVLPYGAEMEGIARSLLNFSRSFNPRITQLATTCALEHFTAMFAHSVLRDQDEVIERYDPAFAALWLWHAAEETEHKAVCFDVYEAIAGKGVLAYLHRVVIMASVSLFAIVGFGVGVGMIAWKQRRQRRAAGADATKAPPKLKNYAGWASARLYFDYYRPSFHPWNHDNSALVARWKTAYANFPGIAPASGAGAPA
jgi:predicted metal-dependent hydrolase